MLLRKHCRSLAIWCTTRTSICQPQSTLHISRRQWLEALHLAEADPVTLPGSLVALTVAEVGSCEAIPKLVTSVEALSEVWTRKNTDVGWHGLEWASLQLHKAPTSLELFGGVLVEKSDRQKDKNVTIILRKTHVMKRWNYFSLHRATDDLSWPSPKQLWVLHNPRPLTRIMFLVGDRWSQQLIPNVGVGPRFCVIRILLCFNSFFLQRRPSRCAHIFRHPHQARRSRISYH